MDSESPMRLPYDSTCPVIYDNDAVCDVYTDEYLMALASAGDIRLVGMITSSSIQPYNPYVPARDYESSAPADSSTLNMVKNRARGAVLARRSGFKNIPDPVRGVKGHLTVPDSGEIEDTVPFGSEGSWLIVNEARKTTADRPLVLVMGGPLSVAADAVLLDRSVAERVIVAWLGGTTHGMNDYNGGADPWAACIVLQRLRLVHFPGNFATPPRCVGADPRVPKARLYELPDRPLRQWMIEKDCPTNDGPDERDGDGPPAISLMRADYVLAAKRVSFSHWADNDGRDVPVSKVPFYRDDPNGRALVVTRADRDIATEEWWRAMKSPVAWGII
jgi:hypothetical protein